MKNYTSLLLIIYCILSSCNRIWELSVKDHSEEIEAITTTIHSAIGWAQKKDIQLLYRIIANDSSFLEVHPGPVVIKGFSEFRKAERIWMSPDFKALSYNIRDLKISISKSGEVAWWYCILDDINEWKGQPSCWKNTRWTGVMEKRKDGWVIVQQHFSFAE